MLRRYWVPLLVLLLLAGLTAAGYAGLDLGLGWPTPGVPDR
jgi:hypothetical protein